MSDIGKDTCFVKSLIEDKADPELGAEVKLYLQSMGVETIYSPPASGAEEPAHPPAYHPRSAFLALKQGVYLAYKNLGLDVDKDPSIQDTPSRFAKMFVGELTKGLNYDFFPKCTATPNGNVLADRGPLSRPLDEVVMVKSIRITSLCEHHLQTIDGFVHIAYKPKTKILGLSKFARVAEFFAARPQIQERMTEQIYHALSYILGTADIAVVVDAVHFCMRARGVKQPESWTQTNKMGGIFLEKPEARKEFLDALPRP